MNLPVRGVKYVLDQPRTSAVRLPALIDWTQAAQCCKTHSNAIRIR